MCGGAAVAYPPTASRPGAAQPSKMAFSMQTKAPVASSSLTAAQGPPAHPSARPSARPLGKKKASSRSCIRALAQSMPGIHATSLPWHGTAPSLHALPAALSILPVSQAYRNSSSQHCAGDASYTHCGFALCLTWRAVLPAQLATRVAHLAVFTCCALPPRPRSSVPQSARASKPMPFHPVPCDPPPLMAPPWPLGAAWLRRRGPAAGAPGGEGPRDSDCAPQQL